jgi:methyltransferase-like protein/2-polyprenyl-3-methyl-5-hydroxy-6-metoxy-1,4-benzoquinol methylase
LFTAKAKRVNVRGMSSKINLYDSVPYPSLAFLQTHPDRLAVMGTLFGMNPVPVEHCRVLEIACGNGSNLIPMAYGLPGSEFVGLDLAEKPVEVAQERIRRLPLKNIRIEQMDLMEFGPEFGEFDYIIAHGVYAWVPKAVQDKILAICRAHLSANGVAFVSYNTNPAGHVREVFREMMQFHERRTSGAANPVKTGREFLELILKATDAPSPWKALFQDELKLMFNRDEKVVYHDDLAECFLPVSFGDFAERAQDCGLQFLSEAHLNDVLEPELGAEALGALSQLAAGDLIAYQQYLDFARYRRFRQTLLCHADLRLRREAVVARARKLLIASPLRATADQPDGAVEFSNIRGAGTLTTNNPVIIAVLRRLEQIWPRAERLEEVVSATLPLVSEGQHMEAVEGLAQAMLKLAASTLADLRTYDLPLASGVSERPEASLLARSMVHEGGLVTTLLHTHLNIEDEQGRRFLQLLDGTRDRQALTEAIAAETPTESREIILKQVDGNLINFYRMGLLVA